MKNYLEKIVFGCICIALLSIQQASFGQGFLSANVGPNKSICQGEAVDIGSIAIAGHTYSWSPVDGLNSANVSQPLAQPSLSTVYYLTETDTASNIQKTDSVIITVNPLPAAIAGSDKSVCYGENVIIGADPIPGNTYIWTPSDGLASITDSRTIAYPINSIVYFLTEIINTTGCQNTNSVTITVNSNPEAKAGPDRSICLGENVPIGFPAEPGYSYQWTSNNGQGSYTDARPKVDPTMTTKYHLEVTNTITGCQNSNNVTVTVNPLPDASTGPDKAICLGESVTIGSPAVKEHTYSWDSIDGLNANEISQPIAKPKITTTYFMTETIIATGCRNTNSVIVTVNRLPEAYTGPDKNLCYSRLTEIGTEPVDGNTYLWTPIDGLSIPDYSQPAVTTLKTTTYFLTETDTVTGCRNTNSVIVTVIPQLTMPSDPTGITDLCQFSPKTIYSTTGITGASKYNWSISPSNAGTISGTNSTASVTWNENFSGLATIKVNGANSCYTGPVSNALSVMVNQAPPKPIISLNKYLLTSSSTTGNYWYDSNGLISGAVKQTYKPTMNGNYYVIVYANDCSSKPSNSIYVTPEIENPASVNTAVIAEKVVVYPNPNSGRFIIQIEDINTETFSLNIYNSIGKTVYQREEISTDVNDELSVNIHDLEQGVYYLKIHSNKFDKIARFVVRK